MEKSHRPARGDGGGGTGGDGGGRATGIGMFAGGN